MADRNTEKKSGNPEEWKPYFIISVAKNGDVIALYSRGTREEYEGNLEIHRRESRHLLHNAYGLNEEKEKMALNVAITYTGEPIENCREELKSLIDKLKSQ